MTTNKNIASKSQNSVHIVFCVCSDDSNDMTENDMKVFATRSDAFKYLSALSEIPINDIEEEAGESGFFSNGTYVTFYYFEKKILDATEAKNWNFE